ncbi:MAG: hypothetical protein OEZ43_08545 [Gammaproteobacteria bacterium]|nr:hypothetical protein [Gammaproteobacteria bacterium]
MGNKWNVQKQGGFTLVNLAGLVVSSGIAFGVAVQGVDYVGNLEKENFYKDLTQLESHLWAHREIRHVWPGDCDGNGVISYHPDRVSNPESVRIIANSQLPASCRNSAEESITATFDALRQMGIVDAETTNFKLSQHRQNGHFQVGHGVPNGKPANVVVAYNVSVDVARWVDETVDGQVDGGQGRVRRWDEKDAGSDWDQTYDGLVTLAYYFERKIK